MKKKLLASVLSLSILFVFGALTVHAQLGTGNSPTTGAGNPPVKVTLNNPFGNTGDNLIDLVKAVINNIVLPLAGVLIVLAFIFTGFKYVMARGNPSEIGKAHNALKFTVIGTAILLGATAITEVITGTLQQFQVLK